MSRGRVRLEIEPLDSATVQTPPIVIVTTGQREREDRTGTPLPDEAVRVCLSDTGGQLAMRGGGSSHPLSLGRWIEYGAWRLRLEPVDGPTLINSPDWAAPEIWIKTDDGKRKRQLRCKLPCEEASQLVVGRSSPDVDLIIEHDPHISRVHMRFFVKDHRHYVEDLNSKWGTYVNGDRVDTPKLLAHGNEVRIGNSIIEYVSILDLIADSPPSRSEPESNTSEPSDSAADDADPLAASEAASAVSDSDKSEPAQLVGADPPPQKETEPRSKQSPARELVIAAVLVFVVITGLYYLGRVALFQSNDVSDTPSEEAGMTSPEN